jgi:hypothetical protein
MAASPTRCAACGRDYDPDSRGVQGPFHFLIRRLARDPNTMVRAFGEWRSGAWRATDRCVEIYRDKVVPIDVLSVEADSLVFDPRTTESVAAGGCVWSTDAPPGTP